MIESFKGSEINNFHNLENNNTKNTKIALQMLKYESEFNNNEGIYIKYPHLVNNEQNFLSNSWSKIKDGAKFLQERITGNIPSIKDIKKYFNLSSLGDVVILSLWQEFKTTFSLEGLKTGINDILNGKIFKGLEKIINYLVKKIGKNFPASRALTLGGKILSNINKYIKLRKVKIEHNHYKKGNTYMGEVFLRIKKNGKRVRKIGVNYFFSDDDNGNKHIYIYKLGVNHRYFKRMGIGKMMLDYIKNNFTLKKGDTITLVNAAKDINTGKKLYYYYSKQGFKRTGNNNTEIWTKK